MKNWKPIFRYVYLIGIGFFIEWTLKLDISSGWLSYIQALIFVILITQHRDFNDYLSK